MVYFTSVIISENTAPSQSHKIFKITWFFQINIVRHDIDFVKVNGCAAKRFQIKKSPSMTALDDVKKQVDTDEKMHRKGEVPK